MRTTLELSATVVRISGVSAITGAESKIRAEIKRE